MLPIAELLLISTLLLMMVSPSKKYWGSTLKNSATFCIKIKSNFMATGRTLTKEQKKWVEKRHRKDNNHLD